MLVSYQWSESSADVRVCAGSTCATVSEGIPMCFNACTLIVEGARGCSSDLWCVS